MGRLAADQVMMNIIPIALYDGSGAEARNMESTEGDSTDGRPDGKPGNSRESPWEVDRWI